MQPQPGNAIVKVPDSEYGDVPITKTNFHSVTWGEIIKLHDSDVKEYSHLIGRIGHWHKFIDDIMLPGGYSVVPIADIKATTLKEPK